MMEHIGLILESLVGAAFVIFYSFDRFSKPPAEPGGRAVLCHSRATTTAAAYYTAVTIYCGVALSLYLGLMLYPSLLQKLAELTPSFAALIPDVLKQSPSVMIALLLTVLMPKVPILAGVDDFFRKRLQHMAAIPHEVRRLAAELRRAPFRAADEIEQTELTASLTGNGFDAADLCFTSGTSPQALWAKLATLMRRLEAWEADGHLKEYLQSYPAEMATLRERYEATRPKAARCFSLSRELAEGGLDGLAATALVVYREDVIKEIEALLKSLYDAIARAALLCDLTQNRRARRLLTLGFGVKVEPIPHLSVNSLMLLFTAGSVLFTFAFLVAPYPRRDETPLDLLLRSVMIAAIYCVALWCAVMPKGRWSAARRHPGTGRPWTAYLLSAITAAVMGVAVNFLTKLLHSHGSLEVAWERTCEGMPWAVMTFAIAYSVAALADDESHDFAVLRLTRYPQRLVEAGVMVIAMVPVALFVQHLLQITMPPTRIRSLWLVLPTTVVVAFAIGALVPSWYRDSPRTTPNPQLTAAPAEAAAQ